MKKEGKDIMPDKILRIFFSGISTLSPGCPRGNEKTPEKAFVLMAANRERRKNDQNATVEVHSPYIFVPVSVLAEPKPTSPLPPIPTDKFGDCFIYFIDNARVVVEGKPSKGINYHVERDKHLAERPGSNDVASEHDIRWLGDFRDILPPAFAALKPAVDPAARTVGEDVAVVVELAGGTWKSSFPCKTVQPRTFLDTAGKPLLDRKSRKPLKRVLANEFCIEIPFPGDVHRVKLKLKRLRHDMPPAGLEPLDQLVLQWGNNATIDVHMGNDTVQEATLAASPKRCDARFLRGPNGQPVLVPRDDDFFLHYQLIAVPDRKGPLPQNGPQQTHINGCVPFAAPKPTGT